MRVEDFELEDYRTNPDSAPDDAEYDLHYSGHGTQYTLEHVHMYDIDANKVIYHANHLPKVGCKAKDYDDDGEVVYINLAWDYCKAHAERDTLHNSLCWDILATEHAGYGEWIEERELHCNALADLLTETHGTDDDDVVRGLRLLAKAAK